MISLLDFFEWASVITALIYIALAAKGNRWCFLFGLISSALFVYICFVEKLYFDTTINLYYVVMSFVGWFAWTSEAATFEPARMSRQKFLSLCSAFFGISLLLGYFADRFTDAHLTYIDSFTTVFAVLATWMLVKKFYENWLIWILVDGVSVFMYGYKDHWPIAGLFAIYTIIAAFGYFRWKRNLVKT